MATKKIRRITDLGTVVQAIFADLAGVIRVSESGLNLTPVGALNAAKRIGENTPILIYNSGGAAAFVKFGSQSVIAPVGAADGIPVLAGQTAMLNSGDKPWVIGTAATVFGYTADTE